MNLIGGVNMNVTFWNFSKRQNSTKVPTSGGTVYDVKLKDDTSLLNPVFILIGTSFYDYN